MTFAGETSIFTASFPDAAAGTYDLQIVASDAGAVNFGMATQRMVVGERAARDREVKE